MYINTLNNNINAIQCLQKDLGVKLNKALTLGISNKDCLEKDNYLITAILRVLYNAIGATYEVTSHTATATCTGSITFTDGYGDSQTVSVTTAISPYNFCVKKGTTITNSTPGCVTITLNTEGCPLDENNCLTDDELCSLIEMSYSILNVNCC